MAAACSFNQALMPLVSRRTVVNAGEVDWKKKHWHRSFVLQSATFSDACLLYIQEYKADHAAHGAHDAREVRVHPHARTSSAHGCMSIYS
jgi:hypothetical protein